MSEVTLADRLIDAAAKWRGTNADILFAEAADAIAAKDAYIDALERERDELASSSTAAALKERALIRSYAHEATKVITELVGGGSECFSGRIGEMYIADLPFCKQRFRDRETRARKRALEAGLKIAAAEVMLEALRLAEPVIDFSLSYYGSDAAVSALKAVQDAIAKAEGRAP